MAKVPDTEKHLVDGPAGRLEAMLEVPQDVDVSACAVICHPHPVHGGTMLNKVVHTLARAFARENIAVLRFNFRGVGQSEGEFDEGVGELQDVLAAVAWARQRFPDKPLWLAGFSFGGAMAVLATKEVAAAGLVSVAPAIYRFAKTLDHQPDCPWLIVQGDKDELVDIEETVNYFNTLEPGPELAVLPDAEHFFHGRLVELRDTVEAFIRRNH